MLGYLILVAIQLAAAWFSAPEVLKFIPISGDPKIFVTAAVFSVIVWIVGVIGSFVLKDVKMPASATLASALVGALVGAAITLVPVIINAIPLKFDHVFLPLAGAVLGYLVRR